jgi:hypothetical protein
MVRISKEGIFFEFVEVDEDGNEVKKSMDVLEATLGIASYLTFPVTIDDGVVVEDIMDMLALNPETTDFIFDSSLGGQNFQKFWLEMRQDDVQDPLLVSMEIAHEVDPITESDPALYGVPRMRGVSVDKELFSVEFSAVSTYKRMQIRLNTNYIIRKVDDAERETVLVSCTKAFTLFEVVHAMLYEMSYYGDPDARKVVLDEVMESLGVDAISAFKLSDKSSLEVLKKELQAAIDAEDYEEAARIRDKINKMFSNDKEQNGEGGV